MPEQPKPWSLEAFSWFTCQATGHCFVYRSDQFYCPSVLQVEQYTGGRTHEELKNFVNNKLKELGEASFGQEEEKVPENLVEVTKPFLWSKWVFWLG